MKPNEEATSLQHSPQKWVQDHEQRHVLLRGARSFLPSPDRGTWCVDTPNRKRPPPGTCRKMEGKWRAVMTQSTTPRPSSSGSPSVCHGLA